MGLARKELQCDVWEGRGAMVRCLGGYGARSRGALAGLY